MLNFDNHEHRDQQISLASTHTIVVGASGIGKDPMFNKISVLPFTAASDISHAGHCAVIKAQHALEKQRNASKAEPFYPIPLCEYSESASEYKQQHLSFRLESTDYSCLCFFPRRNYRVPHQSAAKEGRSSRPPRRCRPRRAGVCI